MSFMDTVSEDYKIASYDTDAESATFNAVRSGGTTAIALTHVDFADLTTQEIADGGGYWQQGDRKFYLPREQITSAANYPQPGDNLVIDGATWHLLTARLDSLGISFEVVGRKAR